MLARIAAPTNASVIAVLSTSATVIDRLRRMPDATPLTTKFARMYSSLLGYCGRAGRAGSAADPVHAAVLVANDLTVVEFDDPPAHRVDDVVVVRGHQDGGADAVDPLQQAHDPLAGVRVEVAGGLVGQQHERFV